MRTAEEIIKERYPFYDENIVQKDIKLNGEQVQQLINEARKEAIEECIKTVDDNNFFQDNEITDAFKKLINEIK